MLLDGRQLAGTELFTEFVEFVLVFLVRHLCYAFLV